jgi:release factor glutamine methyltransferase
MVARLRAAGCVFAEEEAELLAQGAPDPTTLKSMVDRRVAGEPLEQILGWAWFHGRRIAVAPGVFVPRARTGYLVDLAAALARPGSIVVDLCCGSGAIAAALTAEVAGLTVYAADIDPAAVRCARGNLPATAVVAEGDLFAPLPPELRGRVGVVTANVPYVPTAAIGLMPPEARDHEPRSALDGGADGLDGLRRVAAGAGGWLAPGGHLLIETSDGQAPTAAAIFAAAGLRPQVATDEELGATVVIGQSR